LAYAVAQGGTQPYTFSWDNNQWTGDTVGTLTEGLHTVVVTDARGCTAQDTILTHEPDSLYIVIDDSLTILAYCIGVNTASLTAVAGGGTPGYSYEWDDNGIAPQTTTTATNLLAGIYTITVTDSKGCTASDTRDIDIITNTMDAQVISLIQYIGGDDISCFGEDDGAALVTVTTGSAHAPYSYQWYGPNGFNSNNDSIDHLYGGTYSVTVQDTNNCMVTRNIDLTEPAYLYFNTSGFTDESCLGECNGEIVVDSIAGGVASYIALLTDNVTGFTTAHTIVNDSIISTVCSGDYTITITDANDCPSSMISGGINQQTIGTNDTTEANINLTSIVNVLCNGAATGELQVLDPDTNAGYTYSWQNVNDTTVIISGLTATNLIAGDYVLYAEYINYSGCTTTDTVTITEISAINISASITDVDCYGNATGSVTVGQTVGGTAPYLFQWNPGGQNTNLIAGTYTLVVTDSNSCQQLDTFEITQPQALSVSITQNGYVLTANTPNGGTLPFSYSWSEQSNPSIEVGTGITYVVDDYGVYYVQVTDANGCIAISNSFEYEYVPPVLVQENMPIILSIYPNPFNEETTVDFGRVVKEVKIKILDVLGKCLNEYSLKEIDKFIIDREGKVNGVYFIEITMDTHNQTVFKLIIK
jgi:hypothetical protein